MIPPNVLAVYYLAQTGVCRDSVTLEIRAADLVSLLHVYESMRKELEFLAQDAPGFNAVGIKRTLDEAAGVPIL